MNGVALALALAALGVEFDVQKSEDNKLEYVVQMEPELLKSLAEGREIHSAVPPDVGNVQRILIRIGTTPAKHSATSIAEYSKLLVAAARYASADTTRAGADPTTSIVWPAKTKPEINYYVKHGYQPDSEGVLSYYVQIDPTLLATLKVGDEIRAGIDPAAGRIGRFVIRAGSEDLPRVPVEPVAAPRDEFQPKPPLTRHTGDAYGGDAYAGAAPYAFGAAPSTAPPTDRSSTPLPSTPDYRTASTSPAVTDGSAYGQSSRGGSRFNASTSDVATGFGAPNTELPPAYRPAPVAGYESRLQPPPRATIQPPTQYDPSQGYVARNAAEPPPVTYQSQQNYGPAPPAQDRLASVGRPTTTSTAGVPTLPAPQITGTGTTKTAVEPSQAEKPYMPLMFTCIALFLSIGGNLYLGYTAGEYYSRYRLATERLRSAGRS